MKGLTLLAGLAFLAQPVQAEEIIFRCYFDWMCDPNTKCDHAGEDIRFRIDVDANTVSRLGGNDLSEFELRFGDRALTVLETPISGGTVTTTIMMSDGAAVHSENLVTGRNLTPRQFVGECYPS